MTYKTITLTTTHQDSELVACAMFDVGASGVSIFDKQDFFDLSNSDVIWDYVDESILAQSDDVKISTIVDSDNFDFEFLLSARLKEMKEISDITYSEIIVGVVDDQDWENEWKKYYKPIVTKHITIVPTWIKYDKKEGEVVMRLDPGMVFGTGEHSTTRMCLELMDVEGKSVIDVGCGSGILGIAAELCGAKSVYMCDIDKQAVEFAKKNVELNNGKSIVESANLIEGEKTADFIFANITADILMLLAKSIKKHLNKDGRILLSGIINTRESEVEECYLAQGFDIVKRENQTDWVALLLKLSK